MAINMNSIMDKLKAYTNTAAGKKKMSDTIDKYRKDGTKTTEGGGAVVTIELMEQAAAEMISILKETASSKALPASVLDHFESLRSTAPVSQGIVGNEEMFTTNIYFTDDLTRPSLLIISGPRKGQRTGEGVKNIVSLFDTGYDASKQVRGEWDGQWALDETILSLTHRDSIGFIREAVETFNRDSEKKYNAYAVISADPKYYLR